MLLSTVFFFILVPFALAVPATRSIACNNAVELCDRTYDNTTYLGAHDSPFLSNPEDDLSAAGNQYYNTSEQLAAGVRLLTAQVHQAGSSWNLCHTSCDLLNAGLVSTWLTEIKTFMDNNPNEVVTVLLVNSDNASVQELDEIFEVSGIKGYAYSPENSNAPPASGIWPTLQTLISQNKRLMVFIASLPPTSTPVPYLMDEFTFVFENPYDVTDPEDFTCTPQRPSEVAGNTAEALSSGRMPLMNHFLDTSQGFGIETPNVGQLPVTNAPLSSPNGTAAGALGKTAQACAAQYGKAPTFILVDYFNVGPAIKTVDDLNGVTAPVGRLELSQAAAAPNGAGSHRLSRGGKEIALLVTIAAMCVLLS